jgi:hypothetical protein
VCSILRLKIHHFIGSPENWTVNHVPQLIDWCKGANITLEHCHVSFTYKYIFSFRQNIPIFQ